MKKFIYLLMSVFIFASCSVSNRIAMLENAKNGLKSIRLEQAPEVKPAKDQKDFFRQPLKNLSTVYLFEEKNDARPEITLDIHLGKAALEEKMDSALFVVLDGEKVPLYPPVPPEKLLPESLALSADTGFTRKFMIPENLWISMVHSKDLSYLVNLGKEETTIRLNASQKNKLVEFLELCIRQRDEKFPAVPEGQVKW